jgi:hypothetical protein
MAMPARRVEIRFDDHVDLLRRCVQRSVVMMGIGTNASQIRPHVSHELLQDRVFAIRLLPQQVNDATREHLSHEFSKWIAGNSLRELLEGYSIFLLRLYTALFIMRRINVRGRPPGLALPPRFERMGLNDQLLEVGKIVNVDARTHEIFQSLNQARNCFAHRLGRVGNADVNNGQFRVTWDRLTLGIREPDGNVIPEGDLFDGALIQGGEMLVQVVAAERVFNVGDELLLPREEFMQIALYAFQRGEVLIADAVQLAIQSGLLQARAPV